jgi:hypothetical protein
MRKMSKAVLIRSDLNTSYRRVRIQPTHLIWRYRRPLAPSVFMSRVRERMLDVELQMIALELSKCVNQRTQLSHRRHPISRHIKHQSAPRDSWPIFNHTAR